MRREGEPSHAAESGENATEPLKGPPRRDIPPPTQEALSSALADLRDGIVGGRLLAEWLQLPPIQQERVRLLATQLVMTFEGITNHESVEELRERLERLPALEVALSPQEETGHVVSILDVPSLVEEYRQTTEHLSTIAGQGKAKQEERAEGK